MNQEVYAMKGKVASKVVDYAVEAEKQKLKKKAKKREPYLYSVSEFLLESIGE